MRTYKEIQDLFRFVTHPGRFVTPIYSRERYFFDTPMTTNPSMKTGDGRWKTGDTRQEIGLPTTIHLTRSLAPLPGRKRLRHVLPGIRTQAATRGGSFAMEGQSPVSYLPSSIRPADREPFLHHFQTGSLAEPLQKRHFLKNLYRACTACRPHPIRNTATKARGRLQPLMDANER